MTHEHTEQFLKKVDGTGDRILIMGPGNTIMGDEGIGPRCIEELDRDFDFPANVTLMDAGTMGLLILDSLRECDRLIVIDAAQETGHPAGTVLLFTPEELATNQVMHSAHDMRLVDVLKAAALMDIELKSKVIIGVQVQDITQWVLELSPAVEAAVPVACAAALDQLAHLGIEATPKPDVNLAPALLDARENFAPMPEENSEA